MTISAAAGTVVQVASAAPVKINLEKNENINLAKEAPGVTKYQVGLGWDAASGSGAQMDLDVVAILLNKQGQAHSAGDFVFYNKKESDAGPNAVTHTGDNLTGQGDGDDETVLVDLAKLPATVERVVFGVNIHQAAERGQKFGAVKNAYVRLINPADGSVLAKYNLTEDYSRNTGVVATELYRHSDNPSDWKFKGVEEGLTGDLRALMARYGL